MSTPIKNGQAITLSVTETDYELDIYGFLQEYPKEVVVAFTLVSGTCQATVVPISISNSVLNSSFATWSTAGDKFLLTIHRDKTSIRMKCAVVGVVNVNW